MRCSNIGPRGARNWFRVLDSPRQLLSPAAPGSCRRAARTCSCAFRRRSPADSAAGAFRCARAPARRHPVASGDISATCSLGKLFLCFRLPDLRELVLAEDRRLVRVVFEFEEVVEGVFEKERGVLDAGIW